MVPCTECSVEREMLGNIIVYVRVIVGSMIFFSPFPPCKSFYLCKAFKYRLSLYVCTDSIVSCVVSMLCFIYISTMLTLSSSRFLFVAVEG